MARNRHLLKSRPQQEHLFFSQTPRLLPSVIAFRLPFNLTLDLASLSNLASCNNPEKTLSTTYAQPDIDDFDISPKPTHTTHITMFARGIRAVSRRAAVAAPLARPTILPARQISPAVAVNATRSYHEKVLDHYSRPRNVGSMNKKDSDVGTGLVGAPACGDVMKLQIRVDPETQKISEVKFKTFGCGSAIASSSYLTELVRGMSLDDAGKVKNTEIAKELCLPPVKRKLLP